MLDPSKHAVFPFLTTLLHALTSLKRTYTTYQHSALLIVVL